MPLIGERVGANDGGGNGNGKRPADRFGDIAEKRRKAAEAAANNGNVPGADAAVPNTDSENRVPSVVDMGIDEYLDMALYVTDPDTPADDRVPFDMSFPALKLRVW